ncbi:MAG: hypothetical protein U0271_06690 [Polyangiaceae bacterium]
MTLLRSGAPLVLAGCVGEGSFGHVGSEFPGSLTPSPERPRPPSSLDAYETQSELEAQGAEWIASGRCDAMPIRLRADARYEILVRAANARRVDLTVIGGQRERDRDRELVDGALFGLSAGDPTTRADPTTLTAKDEEVPLSRECELDVFERVPISPAGPSARRGPLLGSSARRDGYSYALESTVNGQWEQPTTTLTLQRGKCYLLRYSMGEGAELTGFSNRSYYRVSVAGAEPMKTTLHGDGLSATFCHGSSVEREQVELRVLPFVAGQVDLPASVGRGPFTLGVYSRSLFSTRVFEGRMSPSK